MTCVQSLRLAAFVAACCLAVDATAQQPIQQQQPGQQGQQYGQQGNRGERRANQARDDRAVRQTSAVGEAGQGQDLDQIIAACLLNANKAEVELGQIAASRAESSDVKEFAQQMIKDHGEVVKKLENLVGSNQPNDRRSQIEKEIADRCHQMVRDELEGKSGKEFDHCYVGSQIAGHMKMAAALDVLSNQTSGELQKIVKDAKPTVDKHLKHVKDLAKSNESRQARGTTEEQTR